MSASCVIQAVTAAGEILPDSHFYFRGRFVLPKAGTVQFKLIAASWFAAWLDDCWLAEGPARFDCRHPEFQMLEKKLPAGEHILAFHVHFEGVITRSLVAEIPLFVFAEASCGEKVLPMQWNCLPLEEAYRKTGRRIDCILGWVEWCRTEKLPRGWRELSYDDSGWAPAVSQAMPVASFEPLEIGEIAHVECRPALIGEGLLVNMSMFTHDPTAGFASRQLSPDWLPPQGRWFRFDLGKVRLGRAAVTVTAPPGTVVQTAYSEFLHNDRVTPYISSSGGDLQTCNLDHFVLRGGLQTVKPLHPKGARFIEVHLFAEPEQLVDVDVVFEERVYYGDPAAGSFSCSDELLNRIWSTGVETLRSCSEDAITDNPTRERGQWLGDAVGAGMDILAVSYNDMRPLKRGLIQAAQCAGPDGMIPAVFPGTRAFLPSFAVQWVSAIPHYMEISGDFQTLEKLYPAAVTTIRCFDRDLCDAGLCMNPTRWNFIDWGYRGSSTGFRDETEHYIEMDPALSLFYLKALQSLIRWAGLLNRTADAAQWQREEQAFRAKAKRFTDRVDGNPDEWKKVGYHTAALALGSGLLEHPDQKSACIAYIKQHILSCFPNRFDAPRLYDTTVESSQLITPFFAHHVFPALIEAGEMDFVLDQIRVCWGHWLDAGLTTWPEVFDLRWSHCHQWSGCPTWLLSRYVLGLHPRFDFGSDHYELRLESGDLQQASGILPVPYSDKTVSVSWEKTADGIAWKLQTRSPMWLHLPEQDEPVRIESAFNKTLSC